MERFTRLDFVSLFPINPVQFQVKKKCDHSEAALKKVKFETTADLDDYVVEIEILTKCKHENIVSLLDVYVYEDHLWVGCCVCFAIFIADNNRCIWKCVEQVDSTQSWKIWADL